MPVAQYNLSHKSHRLLYRKNVTWKIVDESVALKMLDKNGYIFMK